MANINIVDFKNLGAKSNKILGFTIPELSELPYLFIKEDLVEAVNDIDYSDENKYVESITNVIHLIITTAGGEITKKDLLNTSTDVLLSVFNWVHDKLSELIEMEKNNLQSMPDPDLLQAGVHRLNPLGEMVTLMNIAKDDYLLAIKYAQLPYHEVFWMLVYFNIKNDIEKKVIDIKSKKK